MESFPFAILKKLWDIHMGHAQMREYFEKVLSKSRKREIFLFLIIFHAIYEYVPLYKGEI